VSCNVIRVMTITMEGKYIADTDDMIIPQTDIRNCIEHEHKGNLEEKRTHSRSYCRYWSDSYDFHSERG